MDTNLMSGQLIPIAIVSIIAFTLSEAAGAANYIPLNGINIYIFKALITSSLKLGKKNICCNS